LEVSIVKGERSLHPCTTLEEDYIAFLLMAPKRTNCIKQVLLLEVRKTGSKTGFNIGPPSKNVVLF
jgi:hypothetical protein